MKLIPKYNNGKPIAYYTDANPDYQGKYTDSKGNKSVSAKYIYVDENGTPILTKDLDKYDTSNPKYLKKKVLPEVKIEETKTRTFPEWFNDEIMLNPDNIRVKNYRKAETRNPNFSQDWDMLSNIYDFTNIATAGAINRFSPTQNIRLAIDAIKGNNIADSWMGNNGIVTDKFAENHPYWSMAINGVGDMGSILSGSKYGRFIRENYHNLGRYTLDNLMPASYDIKNFLTLPKVLTKPLYQKPPTFHNRKPLWYDKYAKNWGKESAENRFQNGAIWADIPDSEVPKTMYQRNSDGSFRMTPEGLAIDENGNLKYSALINEKAEYPDFFTVGRVGGEHSDYKELGEFPNGIKVMQFEDEQKLNPQWLVTEKIKRSKYIPKKVKESKYIDKIAGKPLDFMLGYKPFTIKQNYAVFPDGTAKPILSDTEDIYKILEQWKR